MATQFQFIMREGPNTGKVFALEGAEITIGRDAVNTISINDAEVSRKHARLTWQNKGYILEDLGSTNGTFVNGQRISAPCALRGGETVAFGEGISLAFMAATDPNATMVSSKARVAAGVQGKSRPQPVAKPSTTSSDYAGQVPGGTESAYPKAEKKKLSPLLLVAIILAVVICVCVVFFVIIDQLNLWCTIFPFLFPGAC